MNTVKSVVSVTASIAVILSSLVAIGGVTAATAVPGTVRFTASGDFSGSANAASVLSAIGTIKPDLHLALGDLSYSTAPEETWCDFVKARVGQTLPFELVAGNHESNGEGGSINNFSACLPNQLPGVTGTYGRQYFVDVPAEAPLVRYVMISPALTFPDGEWQYPAGSARYNWTAAAIDGARTANIPWVVVGMHKPCISMGAYACDPGADLLNLLVNKRVDLVLSGHEHLYLRTHQLATSANCPSLVPGSTSASCIVDSDSTMTKGAGTVFAIVGTGGTPARDVNLTDTERPYFATWAGLNANPTWGSLDVSATATTLSANFARAAGGTFADSFTIGAGGTPNQPPSASFTSTCTQLACTFDSSASSDPDGTIASRSWAYGDGTTGTSASHTYAANGTYSVTLTVTDNGGATASTSRAVTVSGAASTDLARDDFTRTVTSGWGAATLGGAWTIAGAASALQVNGTAGQVTLPAGSTRTATLPVSATSTDTLVDVTLTTLPTGGGSYSTVVGRQVGASLYSGSAWVKSTGQVAVVLKQGATVLGNVVVPGLTYAPGTTLNMRVQVTGTNPTTIRARVWPDGASEPTTWTASATDATAALQAPGTVGLQSYLSSSATAGVVTRFDDYLVRPVP
jgi:PKD repeat protein